MVFEIIAKNGKARAGILKTAHGEIETPAFFAVATLGAVKGITSSQLEQARTKSIIVNTYHLFVRDAVAAVKNAGGLHKFMDFPLLRISEPGSADEPGSSAKRSVVATDSGGFQVFSLGAGKKHNVGKIYHEHTIFGAPGSDSDDPHSEPRTPIVPLVKIDEDGVEFRSHIDGRLLRLNPESSIQIQEDLGAAIIFAFDECTSPLEDYEYQKEAMERTHRWAKRSLASKTRNEQMLFGIVQGGPFQDLRKESAQFIALQNFDGIGIGGSFGKEEMQKTLEYTISFLPDDKPRHLLGIGEFDDIRKAVAAGIDMFDCVMPTRLGRHGVFVTPEFKLDIGKPEFKNDLRPPIEDCECPTCIAHTRSYVHHLFRAGEPLAGTFATIHNLYALNRFMADLRQGIYRS